MTDVTVLSTGHTILEAPRWRDGALYVSDFFTRRVLKFDETGAFETVVQVPGQPSGLGWTPDGEMLVVSMVDRALWKVRGTALEPVADLSGVATWHCNDLVVDAAGRAYVGNFGWDEGTIPEVSGTPLILVEPDGTVSTVADDVVFPNGMVITPDGTTLIVAETFAARLTAFDIDADGRLSNRRVWASFADDPATTTPELVASGVVLPDGITLDSEGAVWVADANGSGVLRVREGGEILQRIPVDEGQTGYAVALGGEDLRTLFMCVAKPYSKGDPINEPVSRLLSCRVEVPGLPQ